MVQPHCVLFCGVDAFTSIDISELEIIVVVEQPLILIIRIVQMGDKNHRLLTKTFHIN